MNINFYISRKYGSTDPSIMMYYDELLEFINEASIINNKINPDGKLTFIRSVELEYEERYYYFIEAKNGKAFINILNCLLQDRGEVGDDRFTLVDLLATSLFKIDNTWSRYPQYPENISVSSIYGSIKFVIPYASQHRVYGTNEVEDKSSYLYHTRDLEDDFKDLTISFSAFKYGDESEDDLRIGENVYMQPSNNIVDPSLKCTVSIHYSVYFGFVITVISDFIGENIVPIRTLLRDSFHYILLENAFKDSNTSEYTVYYNGRKYLLRALK